MYRKKPSSTRCLCGEARHTNNVSGFSHGSIVGVFLGGSPLLWLLLPFDSWNNPGVRVGILFIICFTVNRNNHGATTRTSRTIHLGEEPGDWCLWQGKETHLRKWTPPRRDTARTGGCHRTRKKRFWGYLAPSSFLVLDLVVGNCSLWRLMSVFSLSVFRLLVNSAPCHDVDVLDPFAPIANKTTT